MTKEELDALSLPELVTLQHMIAAALLSRRNAEMLGVPVPGGDAERPEQ
ncbi:hypothetical protein ACN9JG_12270 [Cereibacter azotoformans]